MSEEQDLEINTSDVDGETLELEDALPEVEDFDQNGLLLKIATNGLSIPDYVKKLQEADILVAIEGQINTQGPAKLREMFLASRVKKQNGC